MGVQINKREIRVTCPKGHVNLIPVADWYPCETEFCEKHDFQMGCEICHRFELQGVKCTASGCSETIDAEMEIWEYPEGMEEYRSVSSNVDPDDANAAITVVS